MSAMFGHRWTSSYGESVDPDRVWSATLAGLSEGQIREGMRAVAQSGLDWPPSAPQFREFCVPARHWEHARIAAEDRRYAALPCPEIDPAAAREALNAIRVSLGMAPR